MDGLPGPVGPAVGAHPEGCWGLWGGCEVLPPPHPISPQGPRGERGFQGSAGEKGDQVSVPKRRQDPPGFPRGRGWLWGMAQLLSLHRVSRASLASQDHQ